ncbi:isopenicillin N synthase family dioxygenase [Alloalcanivorax sp. C16-2]|uniref:isopenicillin N synthase family dioxygenase n=1 Tax=Alloalcanivorax TaxID=3020832 RepID=UPI0019316B09|nr:isopenicillin N synthase family oxygenase [Alloalcanivorax marinus]MBL7252413.1 isopenicillin N synthase family oxygenase [Alloalcanivorax marinus]
MSVTRVPVIDFAPFLKGGESERAKVVAAVDRAARDVGFMCLVGHGLPEARLTTLFQAQRDFFALPDAVKAEAAFAYDDTDANTGYVAVGKERLDVKRAPDLKESFQIREPGLYGHVNRWPSGQAAFRATVEDFFAAVSDLSMQVLEAFELGLGTEPGYFRDRHRTHSQILRLLHYPPLPPAFEAERGQARAGGHTDYGSVTLLFQDDIGGLEVRDGAGKWVPVDPVPGGVVINTGDIMARWTNDVYRSTLHRVRLPEHAGGGRARYSVAFFNDPDNDAEIRVLDQCVGDDNARRYPPILTGDYLVSRRAASY